MGPSGVRSLLLELHTLRFNTLQTQYLEAVFEVVCGQESEAETTTSKNTLHAYLNFQIPPFGDFGSRQQYAGFVPSERYLSAMLNKAIETDEQDANQHTAIIAPDQISIDDSHKVWLQIHSWFVHMTNNLSRSTNTLRKSMEFPFSVHYGPVWTRAIYVAKRLH
jgi:hypothetical protein